VVQDVVQNGIIRGTKEYNKDEFVAGAQAASSSQVFPPWDQGGKVFYKVRNQAIDPRNFKQGGDVGTLVVRYVVQPQGEKNTVLRIDALFREDFRKTVHKSNGSVESAEYKDIHEHLEAIEVMKQQNVESERERQAQLAKKQNAMRQDIFPPSEVQSPTGYAPQGTEDRSGPVPQAGSTQSSSSSSSTSFGNQALAGQPAPISQEPSSSSAAQVPAQSLEARVADLRKQVERLVKAPGAPLKSAPFHTASTLQTLTTGAEVLILISTPYWYGVETHDGQHGWMMREQLEQQ
jgi:hypothetical protein